MVDRIGGPCHRIDQWTPPCPSSMAPLKSSRRNLNGSHPTHEGWFFCLSFLFESSPRCAFPQCPLLDRPRWPTTSARRSPRCKFPAPAAWIQSSRSRRCLQYGHAAALPCARRSVGCRGTWPCNGSMISVGCTDRPCVPVRQSGRWPRPLTRRRTGLRARAPRPVRGRRRKCAMRDMLSCVGRPGPNKAKLGSARAGAAHQLTLDKAVDSADFCSAPLTA